jgi:thiamine-monophosphate kinase
MQLAVAADTMLEGRHFFAGTDAYSLGWKILAVNLSDMAAMGAIPRWITLCLTLPQVDEAWLASFSRGIYDLAAQHQVDLVGGDTTRGPLALSVQIIGEIEPGQALRRDGARTGDDIWVSGPMGAANLAVRHRYGQLSLSLHDVDYCSNRLDKPVPRIELGRGLRGIATAAIDISDGLVADLGHIARASSLAANIKVDHLPPAPLSPELRALPVWIDSQLCGGDDYELCFTAAPANRQAIAQLGATLGLPLTRIGQMASGEGVSVLDCNGQRLTLQYSGFNHFEQI